MPTQPTSSLSMNRTTGEHLEPGDGVPSRAGQIWDPTLGAFRAQRLPIALSKSSIATNVKTEITNGAQSPRHSISSYTSKASSVGSSATAYTYLSAHSLPPSLVSQPSSYSLKTKARAKASHHVVFRALPPEVYDCILLQLRVVHETPGSQSCQTCYLRDLCSLSLTSRAWDKVVVKRLYDRIYIEGHDSIKSIKKYRMQTGVRLKLLRRTLRGRSFLAQHVRELKVSQIQGDGDPMRKDLINLVASLVMACPNLERVVGFYPVYGHGFDRLTHALSTRRKLKEKLWLIGENAAITQRSHRQLAPGLMDMEQKSSFVLFHNAWSSLKTLVLHSPTQGILEKDVFVNMKDSSDPRKVRGPGILHRLPALENLCISNFDCDDFDDTVLQNLPALHSLRLQDLEGVTFWGLSDFSRTRNAFSLRSLSIVNLDIKYISAVSNLLLHLKNLKRFTLVQDTSPEVEEGEIVFHPIIASHELEFIHWDIVVPGSAHVNLANSIRAEGFPRLRTIRAPSDHDGLLQALCKPRAQIELPSDCDGRNDANGLAARSLRLARRAAQQRIEEAWGTVQFKVVVEESGVVTEIFDLNGFVGEIGSSIYYMLDPDIPGSDHALVDFRNITHGMNEVAMRDSCKGSWNTSQSSGWHTERSRYRPIYLHKLF